MYMQALKTEYNITIMVYTNMLQKLSKWAWNAFGCSNTTMVFTESHPGAG